MLFKPVKRLSKRQIKEDRLLITIARSWEWVRLNYPKVLAGVAAAGVLIAGISYLSGRGNKQSVEAAEAFSRAQVAAMEGRMGEALIQGEDVSKKYDGTGAGAQALLLVANAYFEMGRVGEARSAFQRCMDDYKGDPIMVYAGWNGLAACLEQEGKLGDAVTKYEGFAEKYPGSPFAPSALKEAARCYRQLGNGQRERATLQVIVDKYKTSPVAFEAQAQLKSM